MIKQFTGALALAFVAASASAQTQAVDPSPFYIGAGVGSIDYDIHCYGVSGCDTGRKLAGKIYAGYSAPAIQFPGGAFINAFEVEVFAGRPTGVRYSDPYVSPAQSLRGIGLVDALRFRVDAVSLTARAGYGYTASRSSYAPGNESGRNANGVLLGLGLGYALDKNWTAQLDWDRLPMKVLGEPRREVNLLTVGAAYHF